MLLCLERNGTLFYNFIIIMVCGSLRVLRLPPTLKLVAMIIRL